EALDEAALPLGVEGVHREAALAAAGDTGDGRELPGGELDADARQVMGAGTLEVDPVHGRGGAVLTAGREQRTSPPRGSSLPEAPRRASERGSLAAADGLAGPGDRLGRGAGDERGDRPRLRDVDRVA